MTVGKGSAPHREAIIKAELSSARREGVAGHWEADALRSDSEDI